MFLEGFEKFCLWLFVIVAALFATAGGLVVWLAPKVWAWLKPLLHALTE